MKLTSTYNSTAAYWPAIAMPVIGVDCIAIPVGYDYIRGNELGALKSDFRNLTS